MGVLGVEPLWKNSEENIKGGPREKLQEVYPPWKNEGKNLNGGIKVKTYYSLELGNFQS